MKSKEIINIIITISFLCFVLYGLYESNREYKNQVLVFWVLEFLHHFITGFVIFGVFIQNQTFYYTLTHFLFTLFIFLHWYINIYVLHIRRCILSVFTNMVYEDKCDYVYHNPIHKLIGIKNDDDNKCKHTHKSYIPSWTGNIFMTTLLVYDIYLMYYNRKNIFDNKTNLGKH